MPARQLKSAMTAKNVTNRTLRMSVSFVFALGGFRPLRASCA